jgi:polyphosphate glucokinase
MKVLVLDVGGTNVKVYRTGRLEPVKIASGPALTPRKLVKAVQEATGGWRYDVVSIGYPGPVSDGRPLRDPAHLGKGWVNFDFGTAFERPVKIINDAAMQALGSYRGGRMLFLGLGAGLGSALVVEGVLEPTELAHLPYKHGGTFEEYVGVEALERLAMRQSSRRPPTEQWPG